MVADDQLQHLQDAVDDPVRWAFFAGAWLLEAGSACLLLRDQGTSLLLVRASVGSELPETASGSIPVGTGVIGVVAERGISLAGEDRGVVFLGVPIMTARGVAGVLYVTDRQGDRQYRDEDIALVSAVAAHIAHHLEQDRVVADQLIEDIPGRVLFEDLLDRELARSRRFGSPLTVAIARLSLPDEGDHALDSGHVIEAVSDALRAVLRRYDVVGQYGHDSVALLFTPSLDVNTGVVRRVSETVAIVLQRMSLDVEYRIGIARCPTDAISATELLTIAGAPRDERVEDTVPR